MGLRGCSEIQTAGPSRLASVSSPGATTAARARWSAFSSMNARHGPERVVPRKAHPKQEPPTENGMASDGELMKMAIARTREGIAAGQTPFGAVLAGGARSSPRRTTPSGATPTRRPTPRSTASERAAATLGDDRPAGAVRSTRPASPARCAWRRSTGRRSTAWSSAPRSPTRPSRASREMPVAAETLAEMGRSPLMVEGGLLREECTRLFEEWKQAGLGDTY